MFGDNRTSQGVGVVLRMLLTAEDLERVRVAPDLAPLIELSTHLRRPGAPSGATGPWLADLLCWPCAPGFLHPHATQLAQAVDAVGSAPVGRVRRDLEDNAAAGFPLPTWTEGLARRGEAGLRLRQELARALSATVTTTFAPTLLGTRSLVRRRAHELQATARTHGVPRTLSSLHPGIRFRPPVLEVDLSSGAHVRAVSGGGGVLLVPTLSPWPSVTVSGTGGMTAVMFPVRPPATIEPPLDDAGSLVALGRLIGLSRARLLAAIATDPGLGVRELARRTDLSPATVSEHLAVLRVNRLVETRRDGGPVGHHGTALGHRLLGA